MILQGLLATSLALVTSLFNGWSAGLQTLLIVVIIDYGTGFVASGVEGKLSSRVGWVGISRKVGMFAVVSVSHLMDQMMGEGHLLRDSTIIFYIANEILSVLENCGRLGIPIPTQIRQAIQVLKGRAEEEKK
ncbi:phage holin family protein [Marininema halotolerans]|uniref:Toxin secretion/phage lysis holin n=1 Tax=Marininema halotolerans TaxID=1155944 RepID=A0A1I6SGE7_9BACL|nr:phage holin family protein [Marininema halotolerans]SFS76017.1 toxin secretion/phage lysis holin [Marininema halotolerans]